MTWPCVPSWCQGLFNWLDSIKFRDVKARQKMYKQKKKWPTWEKSFPRFSIASSGKIMMYVCMNEVDCGKCCQNKKALTLKHCNPPKQSRCIFRSESYNSANFRQFRMNDNRRQELTPSKFSIRVLTARTNDIQPFLTRSQLTWKERNIIQLSIIS